MNRIPAARADGERAADRRRADRALTRPPRRGRAGRPCARRRRTAPSSASVEPDDDLAVEDADRRRHRAALAHRALGREPDRDALAGREAVRDERRLERDDAAAVARARRAPRRRRGSRHRPELRAAAGRRLEPERRAADEEAAPRARRPRRSGRRPRSARPGTPRRRRRSRRRRASRPSVASRSPSASRSRSFGEDEVGRERASRARGTRRRSRSTTARSSETRAPARARELGRAQRRRGDRLAMERVPGHVQRIAVEPRRLELVRPELGRRAAVGGHRPVAAGGERDDDAGPPSGRPGDLDAAARAARAPRARRPCRRRACRRSAPRRRAPPPTRRRSRPARRRRRASPRPGRRRCTSGPSRPDDHVEEQVAEGRHAHGLNLPCCRGRPGPAHPAHPAPLVRARRRSSARRARSPTARRLGRIAPPARRGCRARARSRTRRASSRSSSARRSATARAAARSTRAGRSPSRRGA